MAQQLSPPQQTNANELIRILLYLIVFVGITFFPSLGAFKSLITAGEWNYSPLVYEEAKKAVRKRNEIAQREVLAPYQPPTVVEETPLPEEDSESYLDRIKGGKVYNLSLLWDRRGGGKKPLIVNIQNPTLWQYFVVKMYVVLSSASVGLEIESPQYSTRIQNALQNTIATKTVEEIQHRQGKIRLKEEVRNAMNAILGEGKIVEVYLDGIYFQ